MTNCDPADCGCMCHDGDGERMGALEVIFHLQEIYAACERAIPTPTFWTTATRLRHEQLLAELGAGVPAVAR